MTTEKPDQKAFYQAQLDYAVFTRDTLLAQREVLDRAIQLQEQMIISCEDLLYEENSTTGS